MRKAARGGLSRKELQRQLRIVRLTVAAHQHHSEHDRDDDQQTPGQHEAHPAPATIATIPPSTMQKQRISSPFVPFIASPRVILGLLVLVVRRTPQVHQQNPKPHQPEHC